MTSTLAAVALAGITTVDGTLAMLGLLELRLIVKLVGAGPERVSVTAIALPGLSVRVAGRILRTSVTVTCWLAGVNPVAEAVMVAEPKFTPVTCGCVEGVVWPWAM